jgi:hypothetical protein
LMAALRAQPIGLDHELGLVHRARVDDLEIWALSSCTGGAVVWKPLRPSRSWPRRRNKGLASPTERITGAAGRSGADLPAHPEPSEECCAGSGRSYRNFPAAPSARVPKRPDRFERCCRRGTSRCGPPGAGRRYRLPGEEPARGGGMGRVDEPNYTPSMQSFGAATVLHSVP